MFSATHQLLEQEGLLIRSCLCSGLTDLRNANLNDKGRYYTAFFQLATGIERMAKLALILDHMAQNNLRPPGKEYMVALKHDLETLFDAVKTTSQTRGYTFKRSFALSPLSSRMLRFLSEFAKGMRYANLDALASGNAQRKPLREWNQILQDTIETKIQVKTRQRVVGQSVAVAKAIQDITLVIATDLSDKPLTVKSAFHKPALLDTASKHLVWELLSLLASLRDFIVEAGYAAEQTIACRSQSAANVPHMSEFFDFICLDRDTIFRKKRWP
jgi:hypothetical protein